MYLIDTNVLSEMRKVRQGRTDAKVVKWFSQQPLESLYLSVITIMEIRLGILSLGRRDPQQAASLMSWLNEVLQVEFRGRVLAVDLPVAMQCASLHTLQTRPERDAMIAATAFIHRLTVVTRNVRDFQNAGVKIVNPWEEL